MLNYLIIFIFLILSENLINTLFYQNNNEDNIIRSKKSAIQANFKWKLPIKYFVHSFLKDQRAVEEAIQRIENKTCITFKRDYWYIKGTKGFNILPTYYYCSSPFGPKLNDENYENNILVSPKCQNSVGMVEGLIGTMLGLLSEVNRPDRDNFIEINGRNIYYSAKSYFYKYNKSDIKTYDTGYDFLSALHFFPKNFSKNGELVIKPQKFYTNYKYSMGQTKGLSFNDYKILTSHYCSIKYRDLCYNFGYKNPSKKNPRHEGECVCPTGYTGVKCESNIENERTCGKTILKSANCWKKLEAGRKGKCSYIIKAKRKKNIRLDIEEVVMPESKSCYGDQRVEIKYRMDKGVGGVCICGSHKNLTFVSEASDILIIYHSSSYSNKLKASYRSIKANQNKGTTKLPNSSHINSKKKKEKKKEKKKYCRS
uniref:Metalloendopeptidase n=1 Tax=Strongyloides stercoralis TaxID=6248 RepID=A0A0K0E2F9_STRER